MRFRAHPRLTGRAVVLLVGAAVLSFALVSVASADPIASCSTCHTGGRNLPIYGLHDAHSQRLANQIAAALDGQPVTLSDESVAALAAAIRSELDTAPVETVVTEMPAVNLQSSVEVTGTLPVNVNGVGSLDDEALAALAAVFVLGAAVLTIRAVVK